MIWAWYWYAVAAWRLYDHSVNHDVHDLGLAIIFVIIGTGQRIVVRNEKGKK